MPRFARHATLRAGMRNDVANRVEAAYYTLPATGRSRLEGPYRGGSRPRRSSNSAWRFWYSSSSSFIRRADSGST
jgi:hypothetical protein